MIIQLFNGVRQSKGEGVFIGNKGGKHNIDPGSMFRSSTSTCGGVGVAHVTLLQTGGCSVAQKEKKEL